MVMFIINFRSGSIFVSLGKAIPTEVRNDPVRRSKTSAKTGPDRGQLIIRINFVTG